MNSIFEIQQKHFIKLQLKERTQQQQLENSLKNHQHTLVVMTAAEYFNFYAVNYQRQLRLTEQQAIEAINQLIQNSADITQATKQSWQTHKDTIQLMGTLTPSLVLDMKVLTLLAREMHRSGSLFTQYQIKTYGGKLHVILKGYPGLRLHL
ncbi:hypothetical protein, partial [Aliikangiella maris]